MAIIDRECTFSLDQVVTAAAASTDTYDQMSGKDIALAGLQLMVTVKEAVTASGAATVQVQFQCDDNQAFSTPKTVGGSQTFAKTDLVAGYKFYVPVPQGLDERYVRLYYNVGTGPLLTGKFDASIVTEIESSKTYADAV